MSAVAVWVEWEDDRCYVMRQEQGCSPEQLSKCKAEDDAWRVADRAAVDLSTKDADR